MKKITFKDIGMIQVGTSTTFQLEDPAAVYNAASLVCHFRRLHPELGRKYTCKKDMVNNKITIEAKSVKV